jgi:hypothetical protein
MGKTCFIFNGTDCYAAHNSFMALHGMFYIEMFPSRTKNRENMGKISFKPQPSMVFTKTIFMKLTVNGLHHMDTLYTKLYSNLSRKIEHNGQKFVYVSYK